MVLSSQTKFWRLHQFIRELPKLRIVIHKCDGRVRGRAHLYQRRPCLIELWMPQTPTANDYAELTAALIHEYGHCVLRYTPHSEREAWRWGRRSVPTEVVPEAWPTYKRFALGTYPVNRRNERRIGAFGRSWKWVQRG